MTTRRFVFEMPAKVTIGINAATEVEAWLIIKQQIDDPKAFAAKVHDADFIAPVSNGTRWVGCEPDYRQAILLGKEVPHDDSDMMG